ncbi:hypothetical protein AB1Y20_006093 [Prymnesium parvum]
MAQPPLGEGNLRFYQTLGLPRTDATPADIKRGYKKMSLKYHPDRNPNDPSSTTKFQEVSHAYTVLSSPRLRQIYDSYGEQGLKMYESYMSFAEADDGSKLPVGPIMLLSLVCFGVTLIVGLITTFGILLLLRLNGSIHTKLSILLIPLWLLDAIVMLCLYASVASVRSRAISVSIFFAQLLAIVAFQVLLCLRVDGASSMSYTLVFSPLFAAEALLAAKSVSSMRPDAYESERAAGTTLLEYPLYLVRQASWPVARALLLVLLALRLDHSITCAWTIVFLPLWLLICLEFTLSCIAARADSLSERGPVLKQLALTRSIVTGFAAVLLLLLCIRLDGGSLSWVAIFWPLFLASSIYFCCCCCLCCALSLSPRPEVRDVPPPEGGEFTKVGGDVASDGKSDSMKETEKTPLMSAQHGVHERSGGAVSPEESG